GEDPGTLRAGEASGVAAVAIGLEADAREMRGPPRAGDTLRGADADRAGVYIASSEHAPDRGPDQHLEGDEDGDRISRDPEDRHAAEAAEGKGATRAHAHAPEIELEAELEERVLDQVVLADARAGGGERSEEHRSEL